MAISFCTDALRFGDDYLIWNNTLKFELRKFTSVAKYIEMPLTNLSFRDPLTLDACRQKLNSESGNRTPAIRVKGGDPNHWTNSDMFIGYSIYLDIRLRARLEMSSKLPSVCLKKRIVLKHSCVIGFNVTAHLLIQSIKLLSLLHQDGLSQSAQILFKDISPQNIRTPLTNLKLFASL